MTMLKQDIAIGDYIPEAEALSIIDDYSRQQMVLLIEQLCDVKSYKFETLYLAVSLADRHLMHSLVN